MADSSPRPNPHSLARRLIPLALVVPFAVALVATRPDFAEVFDRNAVDPQTAGCLDNLRQIGRAYALYAQDFDGKIPLGVDPEDRNNPRIWSNPRAYGGAFASDATQLPYLHEVLRPYVPSPQTFRCPADVGWTKSRLPDMSNGLLNVKPSSYAVYGTSYYCFTVWGIRQANGQRHRRSKRNSAGFRRRFVAPQRRARTAQRPLRRRARRKDQRPAVPALLARSQRVLKRSNSRRDAEAQRVVRNIGFTQPSGSPSLAFSRQLRKS